MSMMSTLLNPERLRANLIVDKRDDLPICSISIRFLSGSFMDGDMPGLTRLAWMTAMRTPLTKSYADFHSKLEEMGISFVVEVGKETTELNFKFIHGMLPEVVNILRELLEEPGLKEDNLEEVRRTTLAAIRAVRDDLMSTLFELVSKAALLRPYSEPTLGREEVVKELKLEDLRKHFTSLIQVPFSVAVVGYPQDEEALIELVDFIEGLGALTEWGRPPEAQYSPKKVEEELGKMQVGIAVSYPAPPVDKDVDAIAFGVLRRVLSSMSSRLFIELREKRSLAYEIGAVYTPYFGNGLLTAYMSTARDKMEYSLESLLTEMQRLRTEPPSPEELERAKSYSRGLFLRRLQYRTNVASNYSYNVLVNLPLERFTDYLKLLEEVSVERLAELIDRYLSAEPAIAFVK